MSLKVGKKYQAKILAGDHIGEPFSWDSQREGDGKEGELQRSSSPIAANESGASALAKTPSGVGENGMNGE